MNNNTTKTCTTVTPATSPVPTGFAAATEGGMAQWAVWTADGREKVTGFMFEDEAKAKAAEMNAAQ